MRHISARPEQSQSPLDIIRSALRAAAVAPTMADALDVTGEALRHLAELSASTTDASTIPHATPAVAEVRS